MKGILPRVLQKYRSVCTRIVLPINTTRLWLQKDLVCLLLNLSLIIMVNKINYTCEFCGLELRATPQDIEQHEAGCPKNPHRAVERDVEMTDANAIEQDSEPMDACWNEEDGK